MNDGPQMSLFEIPQNNQKKTTLSGSLYKVCVDGASRNNPGKSGAGVAIYKNDQLLETHGFYLGIKTNNQAEYGALLLGLFIVKKYLTPHDRLLIVSDSQLLVRQLQGVYQIKHVDLKPLYIVAQHLLQGLSYKVMHVLREHNEVADQMANEGIDRKELMPPEFIKLLSQHSINW